MLSVLTRTGFICLKSLGSNPASTTICFKALRNLEPTLPPVIPSMSSRNSDSLEDQEVTPSPYELKRDPHKLITLSIVCPINPPFLSTWSKKLERTLSVDELSGASTAPDIAYPSGRKTDCSSVPKLPWNSGDEPPLLTNEIHPQAPGGHNLGLATFNASSAF